MKPSPYVGITGLKTKEDVTKLNELFGQFGFLRSSSTHRPMYGFVCSTKRMANRENPGSQSPAVDDLAELCKQSAFFTLPAIHYFTEQYDQLADEVTQVFEVDRLFANGYCTTAQLNTFQWPRLDQVQILHKRLPTLKIILQLPRQITEGEGIQFLCDRAKAYENFATYVLIDPSGGEGKSFDPLFTRELHHGLEETLPSVTVGVAGGLSGDNIANRIKELNMGHSKFCIDAQGRLRSGEGKKSYLDYDKVADYIKNAGEAFHNPP